MEERNVSYVNHFELNTVSDTCGVEGGSELCTKYEHFNKNSFIDKTNSVLKTKPYLKNIGPKNILFYSSEKLKQIRNEKRLKISKTKFPFKIPCFKNAHTKLTDPLLHRESIFVTHPVPSVADGACSLKQGQMDGRGGGQKLNQKHTKILRLGIKTNL